MSPKQDGMCPGTQAAIQFKLASPKGGSSAVALRDDADNRMDVSKVRRGITAWRRERLAAGCTVNQTSRVEWNLEFV